LFPTLRTAIALAAVIAAPSVRGAWIEEPLPANLVTVSASSEHSPDQGARHLTDGSGMKGSLHDNDGQSRTMWHTGSRPEVASPAPDLPGSPAWVRFDF